MTADKCARLTIKAVEKRERLLIPSIRGRVGRWIRMFSPALVDRIAAKAIRDRK